MIKLSRKILFTFLLILSCVVTAFATTDKQPLETLPSQVVYNPAYEGSVPHTETVKADRYYADTETDAQIIAKCTDDYVEFLCAMREGMENRETAIPLYFCSENALPIDWTFNAMHDVNIETNNPAQGDYIYYSWRTYYFEQIRSFWGEDGRAYYKFILNIEYYTTAAQEQELSAEINRVINSFGFTANTTNLHKIRTIYDYITRNIRYDYANLNNDNYTLKYTAYAALMHKTAVCQGYALLFYRMAEAVGVDTRVIVGIGNGGGHAWNIVKVGDRYYYLDSTWDEGWTDYGYNYYLRGTTDFPDHKDDEKFTTAEFKSRYPIPATRYAASSSYNPDVENRKFSASDVSLEFSQTAATGKTIRPNVTVVYNGTTLKNDVDYHVSYANNVNLGTATVTITGMGLYTGNTYQKTFEIVPASENVVDTLTYKILDYTAVQLTWTDSKWVNSSIDSRGYRICMKKSNESQYKSLGDVTNGTSCKITGLSANTTYKFMVCKYVVYKGQTYLAEKARVVDVSTFSPLTKVTNLKATLKGTNSVTLSWSAVNSAHGYQLYYCKDNGSWTLLSRSNETATSCTVTGLAFDSTYSFKVLPYHNINGEKSVYTTSPSTVSVKTLGKYAFVTESGKSYYYANGVKSITTGFVTVNSKSYYVVKGVKSTTTGITKISGKYYYLKNGCKTYTFKDLSAPSKATAKLVMYNKVKVSWSKVSGATHYQVYYKSTGASTYTLLTTTASLSYTKTGLAQKTGYYFKVVPCTKAEGELYVDSSCKIALIYTAKNLSAPKKVTAKLTGYDDIKLSWRSVTNAIRYKVYYKKSAAKSYTLKAVVSKTTYSFSNLEDGVKYNFKIVPCAYITGGYIADDSYTTISATTLKKVATPTISKASSKTITIKWNDISGESGYQISKSTSPKKTSVVSTSTSAKKTISATKGRTYYYKVRAFKTVAGKKIYGPWSAAKAYKLK